MNNPVTNAAHDARDNEALHHIAILYATETGASEDVAKALGRDIGQQGLTFYVADMADIKTVALFDAEIALFVTSTTGEGEFPYAAESFFAALSAETAPQLGHLRYAVLALGDSSYDQFCAAGRKLDAVLEKLGATRIIDRVECDLDYEEPATEWRTAVLERISAVPVKRADANIPQGPAAARREKYSLTEAVVVESKVLTGPGSSKATRHIALALSDGDIAYEPGDAIGIIVENDATTIAAVLKAGQLVENDMVTLKGEVLPLREALLKYLEITTITPRFLEAWAQVTQNHEFATLAWQADPEARAAFMHGHHIVDVIQKYPARILRAQDFVAMLRSLQPRLYSIASSLRAFPGQVHITIAPVAYSLWDTPRTGVATGQLCARTPVGSKLQVYIQSNSHFRLPESNAPIIMIGAGTGVAPYLAFLQELAAKGADSRDSWLFFGERCEATDFLYQDKLTLFLRDGVLTRLDTAFSRDGAVKTYVQHRILEHAVTLCEWLERGAHVYVCGDATHMAPDVHRALISAVEKGLACTPAAAAQYVADMQENGRYQRDVY